MKPLWLPFISWLKIVIVWLTWFTEITVGNKRIYCIQ